MTKKLPARPKELTTLADLFTAVVEPGSIQYHTVHESRSRDKSVDMCHRSGRIAGVATAEFMPTTSLKPARMTIVFGDAACLYVSRSRGRFVVKASEKDVGTSFEKCRDAATYIKNFLLK